MKGTTFIILINYNSDHHTIECIDSILQLTDTNFKIIVIDNSVNNDSAERLISHYNLVYANSFYHADGGKIILQTVNYNCGFAKANNIGYDLIKKYFSIPNFYIWILNNDTIVPSVALSALKNKYNELNRSCIVTNKIVDLDNNIWYNGGVVKKLKCTGYHITEPIVESGFTDFATGCSLFLDSMMVEKIGGRIFDESFFMYAEDYDLSLRLASLNISLFVDRSFDIKHKIYGSSGSIKISAFAYFYMNRNRFIIAKRYLNIIEVFLFLLYFIPSRFFLAIISKDITHIKGLQAGLKILFKKNETS